MLDENLKKFLHNKNSNPLYLEFFSKKLLILGVNGIYNFENDVIFELKDNDFIQISLEDFNTKIKIINEELRTNLNSLQSLIEHKEELVLKGKYIENFFRKSFILKQKLNKNQNYLNQFIEALNLLINEQIFLKKTLKLQLFTSKLLEKNAKELSFRIDSLYSLISSIKAEKTNQNIYLLSIISTIVLPLNLIVGFFGMNTGGLFLQNNNYGSLIILVLIILIFAFGLGYYQFKSKPNLVLDMNLNKKDKKSKT